MAGVPRSALFAGVWLLALSLCHGATWRVKRLNSTDKGALCNDGSPAAYMIDDDGPASTPERWLIRFMGGGWCISEEDCKARWANQPHLMSSKQLPDKFHVGERVSGIPDILLPGKGILSSDPQENPYFHEWRRVYLWYCSSDSHLGQAPAGTSKETGSWSFVGKRNTQAMVYDLLRNEDLGSATEILLTGDSAGGVGVMNNAAFVLQLIRDKATALKRYKVLVDAGWFLDIPNYSHLEGFTFQKAAKSLKTNWNVTYSRLCEANFGSKESWRCFHAQYAWPHLGVATLYLQNLYDTANLAFNQARPQDVETLRKQMVAALNAKKAFPWINERFRSQLPTFRRGLRASTTEAPGDRLDVFAPACRAHETIDYTGFRKLQCGGQSMYSVLVDWYENGTAVSFIDGHQGVRPSNECTPSSD